MENEAQQNQCIRCGQKIEPGADNCPYCGAGQREGIPPLPGTEAAGAPAAEKPKPAAAYVAGGLFVLFALLALLASAATLFGSSQMTPETMEQLKQQNPQLAEMSSEQLAAMMKISGYVMAFVGVISAVVSAGVFMFKRWGRIAGLVLGAILVIIGILSLFTQGSLAAYLPIVVGLVVVICLVSSGEAFRTQPTGG